MSLAGPGRGIDFLTLSTLLNILNLLARSENPNTPKRDVEVKELPSNNLLRGLIVLSCLMISSAVMAQQVTEDVSVRPAATLTTTDLLGSTDIASKPQSGPATRSRIVQTSVPTRTREIQTTESIAAAPVRVSESIISTSGATSTGDAKLDALVNSAAERNGIDRRLILAVMKQESSFNPRAISYKGARGLMQLMPATAYRFGVKDIFDPAQNIEGGARYLRFLLDTFNGNVELALAGYNAGENAVIKYGSRIPPYRETQDYVRKISAHYDRLSSGTITRREIGAAPATPRKPVDAGFLTAGQTMTQF